MAVKINFDTYLFISPQKISIYVNEKQSLKKLYHEELFNSDKKKEFNFEHIDDFLEKNIFVIEKNLKSFVENINLILESENFFTIQLSIKQNNYGELVTKEKVIHLLNETRHECRKTINDNKIAHMVVDNYLADKINYPTLPRDLKCELFSIDVRFICLSSKYINDLENVLEKYQISTNRIFQSDYIKSFLKNKQENLFTMCSKIIDGHNENEVVIIPKTSRKKGFFERFFDFF
tara:strand:- start:26 stop:727 length:702 start_codon:yes stop_codon:yes gene_type:complete